MLKGFWRSMRRLKYCLMSVRAVMHLRSASSIFRVAAMSLSIRMRSSMAFLC